SREAHAVARIDDERTELRERRQQPLDALEARIRRSCTELRDAEVGMRIEMRQVQGRNGRRCPEEPRRGRPGSRERAGQGRPRSEAPAHAGWSNDTCGSDEPSSGLACGYASVTR